MKKAFLSGLIIFCFLSSSIAQQNNVTKPKLSAITKQYLANVNTGYYQPQAYVYKTIGSKKYLSAFIKVNSKVDLPALDAMGIFIGTKAGNIWTAQIPVENIGRLTEISGIEYIALDQPVFPYMDSVRKQTRVDSVHKGINISQALSGKGVVAGIIDAGFDFTHPALFDTTYGGYRLKKLWLQKVVGTPPSGFSYGTELTDTNLIKAKGTDTTIMSHGMHVAGITAGSGYGSKTNNRYRGIAYESELMMVAIMPSPTQWMTTGASDMVDGINYIFTKASAEGKPTVVNLSWGSTLGPHDGYALFSQACDALTGAGKIFVCAAGNNAEDTVHLKKTFTATDTLVHTFVTFSPYLDTNHQDTWVDIWGDTGKTYCINMRLYNGATAIDSTGFICIDDTVHQFRLKGSNNDTCFVTLSNSLADFNGKPHTILTLHSKVHDNICLSVKANAGSVNMWEGYVLPPSGYYGALKKLGYSWATAGDVNMTISDLSCTRSAISVGAYCGKYRFTNVNGGTYTYSGATLKAIAPFSSLGPTADGRVKPDITAPGFAVASSVNSFDTTYNAGRNNYSTVVDTFNSTITGRSYRYAMLAGTSMAAPAASGIIALLLQLDPTLTPDHVKNILAQTAIQDTYTGTLPPVGNNTWGHGKINAYRAVVKLLDELTVSSMNMNALDCILYPNPNKGAFTIDYYSNVASKAIIDVYNINGGLVMSEQWNVHDGHNRKELNLSSLAKGIYFTKVSSQSGYRLIKTVIE